MMKVSYSIHIHRKLNSLCVSVTKEEFGYDLGEIIILMQP
jgi:hypothetical protein